MKTKVAAYCRVSTKDKEQLQSLDHQRIYFNREFGESEQYELYRIYADEGKSGTKLSRPAFDKMIMDAGIDKTQLDGDLYKIVGEPKFNRILVKNTSRFARNLSADMLIKTLSKNKVYIDFIDTGLSTEKTADAIALGVLQLLDQEESKDKSRKTTFGILEGARKGNLIINGKIYGYKYLQHENRLEIIQEEAEVIKYMFALYNDNIGAFRISNILMKEGIVKRDGQPFTEGNIRRIIENEKYCGRLIRQKYDTGTVFNKNKTAKKRSKEDQIIFESSDKVPPIVSVADYEKAQNIRFSKTQHIIQKGINHGSTDYAHKIYCGICGAQYTATTTKQYRTRKERYFACVTKRKMSFDEDGNRVMLCNNLNISETRLDNELNSENYGRILYYNLFSAYLFLTDIEEIIKWRIDNTDDNEINTLQEKADDLERKIGALLDLLVDGVIDDKIVRQRSEPLQKELAELNDRINSLKKPIEQKQDDLAEINETKIQLAKRIGEIYDVKQDKVIIQHSRKEILQDVKYIFVQENKKLNIVFNSFENIKIIMDKFKHLLPDEFKEKFERITRQGDYVKLSGEYMETSEYRQYSLKNILKDWGFTTNSDNELIREIATEMLIGLGVGITH